ncbi:hypothetical protein ACTJJB_30875 [Chitinophaga sp. 22536]|uniref:hypothetical protein n=1 Tax=unclassified Chitinophaga TaxID=2619133 RepID=UPI003F86E243
MENDQNKKPGNAFKGIIASIAAVVVIWFYFGGGLEQKAYEDLNKMEHQVAEDAVQQYEIAKRQGDKMQTYLQASMVAQAYLEAKDEANYNKWKDIEKQAAVDAGMPTE